MIDLYYCATPNGLKVRMCLEELGLPYRVVAVNIGHGEQFRPEFLAISPNNKIPALVDDEPADGAGPLALFESGAILCYLAERSARLLPHDARGRWEAMQWLIWQVSGLGPMAGQAGHFRAHAPQPVPYAIERYTREVARLYRVLNGRLEGREFIAGEYSIADIACYPWIVPHEAHGQDLRDWPHLQRWFEAIAKRPATLRAYSEAADPYARTAAPLTDAQRHHLFGATA